MTADANEKLLRKMYNNLKANLWNCIIIYE